MKLQFMVNFYILFTLIVVSSTSSAQSVDCFYKVKKGDQLAKILTKFGFSNPFKDGHVQNIHDLNLDQSKDNGDLIYPDTYLKFPFKYVEKNNQHLCSQVNEAEIAGKANIIQLTVNKVITNEKVVQQVQFVRKVKPKKWKLALIPGMIWQRIDGTQIANKTEGDIISDLSPSYVTKLEYSLDPDWDIGLRGGLRYFLFDSVTSNQTFNRPTHPAFFIGLYGKYHLNESISPYIGVDYKQYLHYTVPKNLIVEMEESFNPAIFLGADVTVATWGLYSLDVSGEIYYIIGIKDIESGFGFQIKGGVARDINSHNVGIQVGWEQMWNETKFVEVNQKELSLYLNYRIGF